MNANELGISSIAAIDLDIPEVVVGDDVGHLPTFVNQYANIRAGCDVVRRISKNSEVLEY